MSVNADAVGVWWRPCYYRHVCLVISNECVLTTNDQNLLPAPIMGRHPFVNLYISLTACKECFISLFAPILIDYCILTHICAHFGNRSPTQSSGLIFRISSQAFPWKTCVGNNQPIYASFRRGHHLKTWAGYLAKKCVFHLCNIFHFSLTQVWSNFD